MRKKDWETFKKSLAKVPLQAQLQYLRQLDKQTKNKAIKKEIKQKITKINKLLLDAKDWKKVAAAPTTAPTRRAAPQRREMDEAALKALRARLQQQSLEGVVGKDVKKPTAALSKNNKAYAPSAAPGQDRKYSSTQYNEQSQYKAPETGMQPQGQASYSSTKTMDPNDKRRSGAERDTIDSYVPQRQDRPHEFRPDHTPGAPGTTQPLQRDRTTATSNTATYKTRRRGK